MLLCVLICLSPDVVGLEVLVVVVLVVSQGPPIVSVGWLVMLWVWVAVVSRGPSIASEWSLVFNMWDTSTSTRLI